MCILNIEAAYTFESLANFFQTTQNHMSQYDNLLSIIHYLYTNSEGQPLLSFSDVSRH